MPVALRSLNRAISAGEFWEIVVKRLILFASVSLVVLSSAARAGDINDGERAVSAHELAPILRSAGLTPISPPLRDGAVFYVQAMDDGDNVRVMIDARTGRIISVRPEGARRYSASRYDRFGVYTPLPPRGIPSAPGARRPAPPPDHATASRDLDDRELDDEVSTGSVTKTPPSALPPPPPARRSATGATPLSAPNVAPPTGPVPPKPLASRPTATKAEASRRITAPDGPKPQAEAPRQTPAPSPKPQDAKPGAIPPMMSHEL